MTCEAYIEVPTAEGRRRNCVLKDGHYTGPRPDQTLGTYGIKADESWHTDCPYVAGLDHPDPNACNHKDHERACMVWADSADGAHPDDRIATIKTETSENQTGRTLTDLGGYRADIKIGDTGASVYGPARFVAYVVRAMADAFEEEAER